MYQTQLLKIKIRPGKTEQVVEFMSRLNANREPSLEAMRREGMVVESLFLERREDGDYLYYYVKVRDLMRANEVNLQATDALAQDIRRFIGETWGEIASPEPLLDLDLIREEASLSAAASTPAAVPVTVPVKTLMRRKAKSVPKPPVTHVSVSVHPSGALTASAIAVSAAASSVGGSVAAVGAAPASQALAG